MVFPHRVEDEEVATEAVDSGTLLAENAALREQLIRALGEAESTRNRAERSAENAQRFAVSEFARELLTVVDNLQRAIEAAGSTVSPDNGDSVLMEGVRATLRMFLQVLERFSVRRIEALGERFDPSLHEAVMQAYEPGIPAGTIVRVLQDGYTIHERLLRPAQVVVSAGPQFPQVRAFD